MLTPTHFAVTPEYFQLYGIKIVAGRTLSASRGEDVFTYLTSGPSEGSGDPAKNEGHNVMVNALLARNLGYMPQEILGKTFIFGKAQMRVVGVTADTLNEGARSPAIPMVYVYAPDFPQNISIRIDPGRSTEALAYIDRISRTFVPNVPISHSFLDDGFEQLYSADKRQGQMFAVFVGVAILIACMGLFGLAAFTAGRRTKEIGIRKVFGARIRDVVWLLLVAVLHSGADRQPDRLAGGLVLSAWLAAGLCLSHLAQPALFRGRGPGGAADRLGDRVLPCPPGGGRQSHPRPALRIGAAMFRNYLVTALRNLARHKLYSFINIAGLAVGLACAILIMLFVRDELSYDKWIPGAENLWRVEVTYHVPGRSDPIITAQTPMPIPPAMHDQIPEVRSATRLVREGMTLTAGDRQFSENVGVVDPNFLQMIALPLVEGDPRTVMSRPENLVISQSAARKYFGDADPVGKTLTTGRGGCNGDTVCANQAVVLKVVGVMATCRTIPSSTSISWCPTHRSPTALTSSRRRTGSATAIRSAM